MKTLANILLGAWLVMTGLIALAGLSFRGSSTIMALVAVVAGVLLLLVDRNAKLSARAADIVLGIWLIAIGLLPLINIRFRGMHTVLDTLALVAGVLVLIRR
jgi:hypothetical protein